MTVSAEWGLTLPREETQAEKHKLSSDYEITVKGITIPHRNEEVKGQMSVDTWEPCLNSLCWLKTSRQDLGIFCSL